MISCDSFRTRFQANTEDAALLEHIRSCDRCLDFAANVDPDVMFRALGGAEMIPPGGVDAFVGDVMRQVRIRDAENVVATPRPMSWTRRLAIAATVAVTVTAATLAYRSQNVPAAVPQLAATPVTQVARTLATKSFATKATVETYHSPNATIVELPAEDTGDDVKIVMIFDESLPADL